MFGALKARNAETHFAPSARYVLRWLFQGRRAKRACPWLLHSAPSALRVARYRRRFRFSINAGFRFHDSLNILIGRLPVADTNAHGAAAAPGCVAKECFAGRLDGCYDFIIATVEGGPPQDFASGKILVGSSCVLIL